MKFALPFVKVVSATSGNLPEVPTQQVSQICNEVPSYEAMLPSPSSSPTLSQASPSTATPHTPAALPGPSDVGPNKTSVRRKGSAVDKNDTDRTIADYFSTKMKHVEMTNQDNKLPKH